jgi:hypothetical protein
VQQSRLQRTRAGARHGSACTVSLCAAPSRRNAQLQHGQQRRAGWSERAGDARSRRRDASRARDSARTFYLLAAAATRAQRCSRGSSAGLQAMAAPVACAGVTARAPGFAASARRPRAAAGLVSRAACRGAPRAASAAAAAASLSGRVCLAGAALAVPVLRRAAAGRAPARVATALFKQGKDHIQWLNVAFAIAAIGAFAVPLVRVPQKAQKCFAACRPARRPPPLRAPTCRAMRHRAADAGCRRGRGCIGAVAACAAR